MKVTTMMTSLGMLILGAISGVVYERYNAPSTNDPPDVTSVASATAVTSAARPCDPTAAISDDSGASEASPREAFEAALNQPDGEDKAAALRTTFYRWVLSTPQQALTQIDRIPSTYRWQAVSTSLAALAAQEPDAALSYMQWITESYPVYLGAVLSVIAQRDPRRALELANQNAYRDPTGEIMNAIVPVIAQSDLDLAATAVANMTDGVSIRLIQEVATRYARPDPEHAYRWAKQVAARNGGDAIGTTLSEVSTVLAMSDPEAAQSYLTRSHDRDIRTSLIRAIALQKGLQDLQSAWHWLQQYRTDSGYTENARNLLYQWSYEKPEEVAAILEGLADADIRASVADELARTWQKKNNSAYVSWVGALPMDSPLRSDLAH